MKKKRIYRIFITHDWYEDYEASTAWEAINMMRAETGHHYYWDLRIVK